MVEYVAELLYWNLSIGLGLKTATLALLENLQNIPQAHKHNFKGAKKGD